MNDIDDVPFSHISLLEGNNLKPFKLFWGDFVGQPLSSMACRDGHFSAHKR